MIKLQLESADFGWRDVETPDDITFNIVREDSVITLFASLQHLAIIHGCVTNECHCEFFIGTGSQVATKPSNGTVVLEIETVRIDVPKDELIEQLERLIGAVCEAKDRKGSSHNPEEKLKQLDTHTAEYYCRSNLLELYTNSDTSS